MDYKQASTPDFKYHNKINAKYAGIVSRPLSRLNFPEADFFEILYFDDDDKKWHRGFGSYTFSFVADWLKSEFEPTYNRLETAITDLLARAEAAEAELDQKEKYYFQMFDALAAIDSMELTETKKKLEAEEERAEKAERERGTAVKLCGKLMALCSPPKEWKPKLFRPCIKRPGDYMGSGYAFLDSFNCIFDEFTETADEETYRAIREASEQEILERTQYIIRQKEE